MRKPNRILIRASALASLLLNIGCDQTPQSPDASTPVKQATVTDAEADAAFGKEPEGSLDRGFKVPDITEAEAGIQKPIIPLGGEPWIQILPQKLEAIRTAYLRQGQPMKARQVENSYDFATGFYRGDAKSVAAAKALRKAAWWNESYVTHRGAVSGYWLPPVVSGAWSGSQYDATQPKFYGFNVRSDVEYGVTPHLRFSVGYNNGAGWTSYKTWNEYHSSGNTKVWLQKLRAYSNYVNHPDPAMQWMVCYDVFQSYPATGGQAIRSGCQDQPAGEHTNGAQVHGIRFDLI